MARKFRNEKSSGRVILLVDDNKEYLEATRLVLEHEGHTVLSAESGKEALRILSGTTIDLVLLDYIMPEMTGEQVVAEIRKFNKTIQVILQTGYASENPPREVLQKLQIQGYYDKSEGTEKLLLWVDVGLKAAYTVNMLSKSKQGLNYILDITPEMHKIQPLDDLLQGILWQFSGLLGFGNSFLAVVPDENKTESPSPSTCESFLAIVKEDMALRIHAGIGKFANKIVLEDVLDSDEITKVGQTLNDGKLNYDQRSTYIPLKVGERTLGLIYLDKNVIHETDLEMLKLFANQAAVAIQNAQLYELATRDQLTGVNVRRYSIQLLTKEMRSTFYSKSNISVMMLDLDNLKKINDTAGHSAGDQALSLLGKVLKKAIRTNDFVGRYGGDEFVVVLPNTDQTGAINVTDRVLKSLVGEKVYGPGALHQIMGSIGVVTLKPVIIDSETFPHPLPHIYFQAMVQIILKKADEMMYIAKNGGGNRYSTCEPMDWFKFADAVDQYEVGDLLEIDKRE